MHISNHSAFNTHNYTIVSCKSNASIYIKQNEHILHMMHSIPLKNDDNTYNMICEIPKHTTKKMEINWKAPLQPIQQDTNEDGTLREYKFSSVPFNYGAFPQTWENPNKISKYSYCGGDDDPLDVIDIGEANAQTGLVYKVKVLGVLGLIDQDETDWKVIAINTCDPLSDCIHNIVDIQTYMPRWLHTTREWLRNYKIPEGKTPNRFLFEGKYQDKKIAEDIISENHHEWKIAFSGMSKY